MGMTVYVYRNDLGDCTAGGISATAKQLCLTNVEGPFEPSEDSPAAVLVMAEPIGGQKILRIEPADADGKWTMFGGNYAGCSDSRFSEKCRELLGSSWYGAVAIHDRIEV